MRNNFILAQRSVPISYALSPTVLLVHLTIASVTLLPDILDLGFGGWLESLSSGEHPIRLLIFTLALELWILLCVLRLSLNFLAGDVSIQETQKMINDQVSANIPLQCVIILLGRRPYTPSELLIYAHNFLVYAYLRAISCFLQLKLRNFKTNSLKVGNIVVIFLVFTHVAIMRTSSFEIGVLIFLGYEGLFILKNSVVALLYIDRETPVDLELRLEIAENLCKIVQWCHLGLYFSDIIPTNPGNIFLFLRIQQFCINLNEALKKYKSYFASLSEFLRHYPPVNAEDVDGESQCCICMQKLSSQCSQLGCKHVFHLVCICKWMTLNKDKRCPTCNTVYLTKSPPENLSLFSIFGANDIQADVMRISAIFPHLPEEVIRRELQDTDSVNLAIENLMINF